MFRSQLLFSLFERDSFALFELFHALANGSDAFRSLQAVKQRRIACGVLNDEFGAAVDRQNKRGLFLFERAYVLLQVALELGDRTDFAKVNRGISIYSIL